MRKSRLSKDKQVHLMEHFVAGTTARTAASLVGVNKSTAAYYFHRLRELVFRAVEDDPLFAGEIEVDESYFGGRRKGKRGRAAAGKVPVFGILKRGGGVYARVIPDTKRKTLRASWKAKLFPTASFTRMPIIRTTCWMFPSSSTAGLIIRNCWPTNITTLTASRIFGIKLNGT
jgi:transposase